MAVWLGGGKSLIADSPKAILHVTPSKFYLVTDLDGEAPGKGGLFKTADLSFFYRSRDAMAGTVVVARNTGQGW